MASLYNFPPWLESTVLSAWQLRNVEGPLVLNFGVMKNFLKAPYDMAPTFSGPPNVREKNGRGKDHPRYGRFIYAFAKHYQPDIVVEVGSFAGGTAIGWATAIRESGKGKLICVDNDTYSKNTYPTLTRLNIDSTGIAPHQYELRNGDSRVLIRDMATELKGRVDCYLVDGDHTYEGARADITNGLPMMRTGGFILIHDVDTTRPMMEQTADHPHPVHEAMMHVAAEYGMQWCILKFIRKHLGILRVG